MNFEKKLKLLDLKYQKRDDNTEVDYYYTSYIEMERLLDKSIFSIFKKENIDIFFNNLDIILKYTNNSNNAWLFYDDIRFNDKFIDKLIDNLDSFRFKDNIPDIFRFLSSLNEIEDKLFCDRMLDKLISYNLSSRIYGHLFAEMGEVRGFIFLKMLYAKRIRIDIADFYIHDPEIIKYISDNIEGFIEMSENFFSLRKLVNDEEAIDKINKYIDSHPSVIVDSIFNTRYRYDSEYIDSPEMKDLLLMIISDIAKNENVKFSEIGSYSKGGYSTVFFINDKVVKIGEKRATKSFPNNPYIVQPIVRRAINLDGKDWFLEIMEKVEVVNKSTVFMEEELYELYKKLRNIGLIWTDIGSKNVGILLKDNVIHWNRDLNPSDELLEFNGHLEEGVILHAGDLVILDADYIFKEDDPDIQHTSMEDLVQHFERRYQKEIYKLKKAI